MSIFDEEKKTDDLTMTESEPMDAMDTEQSAEPFQEDEPTEESSLKGFFGNLRNGDNFMMLMCLILAIILLVARGFLLYKTHALSVENAKLEKRVERDTKLKKSESEYEAETENLEQETDTLINRYGAGNTPEKTIMFLANLSNSTGIAVTSIEFGESENVTVDEKGNKIGNLMKSFKTKIVNGNEFIRKYMSCENPVYNASSAIFKKSVAQNISKQYMDFIGAGDRLFWIEIAEHGDVAVVNKPLNYFRQHSDKVTPRKTLDGTNMRENHIIYKYLCGQNLLSSFRKYLVRGYSLYLIDSTNFESEDIRCELYQLWDGSANNEKIQKLLGRLFVSLHYHNLHMYL